MSQAHVKSLFTIGTVTLGVTIVAAVAVPFPSYFFEFQTMYPGSMTDENVDFGTGSGCQVCHESDSGGDGWNAFGWRVRESIQLGDPIDVALANAQPDDSDMDPDATSNLLEINSSSQPGWTDGPNNTIYFSNGSTTSNVAPPAGILGTLDPAPLGTPYCTGATNSAGLSTAISATGSDKVVDNNVNLIAADCPSGVPGLFFFGPNQVQTVFGDGFRCVGGMTARIQPPVFASMTGTAMRTLDLTAAPAAGSIVAGSNVNFQFWYRDSMAMMTGFNLSNGLNILFQ